ncbi:MAG: RICIN domain-containing protein [Streptosporangiaceae bacterium]
MTGLLAAGAVTASMEYAHAQSEVDYCLGAADNSYDCTVSATVSNPASINVGVTDSTSGAFEEVMVSVTTLTCTDSNSTATEPASSTEGTTPLTDNIVPLPATADGQCTVTATVHLVPPYTAPAYAECLNTTATPSPVATPNPTPTATPPACPTGFTATLNFTSAASPSPSATTAGSSVHPVRGYSGKCLDDKGNSSANRAVVVIWSCSGSDQAENWQYSSNELKHNGKCLNDKGNGGIRSKVILWSCNGASNEKWSELANGELKLQSHSGTLCLDDPGYSTKNGTQLIVYSCKDSSNQKWSLP